MTEQSTGSGVDLGDLEELDEQECWRLLATQSVGRFAVVVGHYPLVFPVNYVLEGRSIRFRTGVGTKLHATFRSNVSFEVDHIDFYHRSGWSVLVKGVAHEIELPKGNGNGENNLPKSWAPGSRGHLIKIVVDQISGRLIRPGELNLGDHPAGYL